MDSAKRKYEITEYAPVLIPTLCRYEHFVRCVESLRNNMLSDKTDLYIGLDYPPSDKYKEGYIKIKEYLQAGIDGFNSVHIYMHDTNLGAGGNLDYLRSKAFEEHTRFIETEDDNEFAPGFLTYINRCLEAYEEDEDIVGVAGFNYPIRNDDMSGNVYFDDCYFAAFGFGSWVSRFTKMRDMIDEDNILALYRNSSKMRSLRRYYPNQYCNFVKAMVGYGIPIYQNGKIWKMDMTYGLYMYGNGKKMVYPVRSKVKNWGYDGSGANCEATSFDGVKRVTHRNFSVDCQSLDENTDFDVIEECQTDYADIALRLGEFFEVTPLEVFKTRVVYILSRVIGFGLFRRYFANKR